MKFVKLFLILLTLTPVSILAQNTDDDDDKLSLYEGSIDSQFEYLIRKSNNYKDYKVVKKVWLYELKAHTLDSLKAVHKELADTRAVVQNQTEEIDGLKANLANTQTTLGKTEEEKNNMALFGLQMSKSSYNVLMWSIIGGLLALLLFFIYQFKNSNAVTKSAKKSLADIEEEFEEHRRTALEREQKVRRQLQDEINKQKSGN